MKKQIICLGLGIQLSGKVLTQHVQGPQFNSQRQKKMRREKEKGERERRDLLTQRSEVDFRCLNCISLCLVCSLTVSYRCRTSHSHSVLPPLCTPFGPFFLPNYSPSYFFILFVCNSLGFIFFLKIKRNLTTNLKSKLE